MILYSVLKILVVLAFFPLMAPISGDLLGFKFGVNSYYSLGLLLFMVAIYVAFMQSIRVNKYVKRIFIVLSCLVVWSVISAFLNPILFEGIPVFSPRLGIDTQARLGATSLRWSFSNFGQAIYLLINFSIVFTSLYVIKTKHHFMSIIFDTFKIVIPLVIFIVFWQAANKFFGLYFPYDLFFSISERGNFNQTMNGLFRMSGTMIEPSVMGGVLASLLIGSIWLQSHSKRLRYKIYPALVIVCILMTTSSTGLVMLGSILVSTALYISFRAILYLRVRTDLFVICSLCTLLFIVIYVQLMDVINVVLESALLEKLYSSSFEHRSLSNLHTFEILKETYFLGSGLGSNRPSSFIASIASNLGVIGVILFLFLIFCVIQAYLKLRKLDNNLDYTFWMLVIFVLSMAISIPDISCEYLWICLVAFIVNANTATQYAYDHEPANID